MDRENIPIIETSSRHEIILEDDTDTTSSQETTVVDYLKLLPEEELKATMAEKRRYISDYAKFLLRDDFIELGKIIKEEGYIDMLRENSDGCRLDLSKVPSEQLINRLFAAVKYKISRKK
jgi:hypothetical protein